MMSQKETDSIKGLAVPSVELLEAELKKEQYKSNYSRVLKSTVFSLLVVAAVAVLIAVLLLPVLQISGTSMTETLQDEDIVVAVNGSSYRTGDVIAFYYNNNILIKRVIASAGDWVDIDDEGNVFVNEEQLHEILGFHFMEFFFCHSLQPPTCASVREGMKQEPQEGRGWLWGNCARPGASPRDAGQNHMAKSHPLAFQPSRAAISRYFLWVL